MPYRRAPYVIAALLLLSGAAFWRGYFSVLGTAPWPFHLHGITASLWLIVLAVQSWSIHHRHNALHRQVGTAALFLFPLLLAGSAGVVQTMARATPGDPFYAMYGARLGIIDATSPFAMAWLFWRALRDRRTVPLHAHSMMATALFLIMPISSRLLDRIVPGLAIRGPQDFWRFDYCLQLSQALGVAVTAWLYMKAGRHGRPLLVTGAVFVAQSVAFETVALTDGWQAIFHTLGALPTAPLLLATASAGAAVSWFGWSGAPKPMRRALS